MSASSAAFLLSVSLAITMSSRSAEAQVCSGATPFSSGRVRLGVGAGSTGTGFGSADGQPAFGGHVAFGAAQGPFASAGAAVLLYTGSTNWFIRHGLADATHDDAGARIVTVAGGFGLSLPTKRRIDFCPIAGSSWQSGPGLWLECGPSSSGGIRCFRGADGAVRAFWWGGTIGGMFRSSPTLAFVPFAGAAYVTSIFKANGQSDALYRIELNIGVGLLLKRLTIRPTVSVPIDLAKGSPGAGIEFTFNFGPKT